jgi:uncharacterized protein
MQQLLPRRRLLSALRLSLREAPVTVLLGARQTGKTTLARLALGGRRQVHFFDLERAASLRALATPEMTLEECRGLVVIDEVQRRPELYAILRPLSDRSDRPAVFLLLGSASPDLVRGVSETLAGRANFIRVPGLALDEAGSANQNRLWLRGGFPRSFLAGDDAASWRWLEGFAATFLERDIPQLGLRVPAEALRRFWETLAHYHGQIWNGSEVARAMGTAPNTVRHYLDILHGAFLVRVLPPWFENLKKRQIKSPKVYIRDSGLLHLLLGVGSLSALRGHPRHGASWEGFALEQVLSVLGDRRAYFWSSTRGAELDLLLLRGDRRFGFEFKCCDAPAMTRSMHIALDDLRLHHLYVIYPGRERYPLHKRVEALPLKAIPGLTIPEE